MSKVMEAFRRSKARAGDAENLPPQRWSLSCPLTARSLAERQTHRVREDRRATQVEPVTGRYLAPGRLSLWYLLIADLRVLSPRVALRVRLPITSLPRPSTKAP